MHFIPQSVLLKALGWSLINSFWQMALLWLLYFVITGTSSRFSARVKHNVALLLLSLGSVWFIFDFIAGTSVGDLSFSRFMTIILTVNAGLSPLLTSAKNILTISLPYLSTVYLTVLIMLLLRYVKYYVRLRQVELSGLQKIQPELKLFVSTVSGQIGIRKRVAVWLSALVDSPMTIGFLKPIILIPVATVNHLTMEQVETILLHELTHIKRNDYLVNLFMTVSGIVFFFNPFSRLFIHVIKKEREYCCDDLVMQFQYSPHTYATALLSLEKNRHRYHQLAMEAVGKSNGLLLERIKRVTGVRYMRHRFSFPLLVCFIISLLTLFALVFEPIRPNSKPAVGHLLQAKYLPIKESEHTNYVSAPIRTKEKIRKSPIKIKTNKEINEEENNIPETDIIQVSNNEQGNGNSDDNVVAAVETTEPRSFSIASDPVSIVTPDIKMSGEYPYVPSSSFSFQLTEDTLAPGDPRMTHAEITADESMEKALKAMNEIDWKKIERQIAKSGKKININKLQAEIRNSLREVDWNKINETVESARSQADEKRIHENIKLQLRMLQNMKARTRVHTQIIQNRIMEQKMQLEQHDLKKQIESIRQSEEQLKKRILRIIYI